MKVAQNGGQNGGNMEQSIQGLGLCGCGCGTRTPIAKVSRFKLGQRRGEPLRFAPYHAHRLRIRPVQTQQGYMEWNGKPIHRLIVEQAIGKPLRLSAPVHHVNFDRSDNSRGNLVACNDTAYHGLLHRRTRALDACGRADWERCKYCKRYGDPALMYAPPSSPNNYEHAECRRRYQRGYNRRAPLGKRLLHTSFACLGA